ncbi:1-acylglycerol-3-phosphate O-acyltransferase [Mycoemilia scoparia]|uniref:1-acyl-sn-glycerol-3-phosphate acyltransferase n=1 Tax=Mycoemilia scoparia TaxID=417184 RepID=A0A9W7ZTD9_9FUNG|nr:1-acylglycerol-3-phosphate O-acyltransferase [Mycoemilia scoparia]
MLEACLSGIAVCPYLWLNGRRADTNWVVARTFAFLTQTFVGVEVIVEQDDYVKNLNKPAVLVGNHQSTLDLCWLGRTFPHRSVILAKESLKYTPFLGWFMVMADNIFVRRGNKDSIREMFKEATKTVHEKNLSVFFFPEGTRSVNPEKPSMLPFKKGAFLFAVLAQIPIVPMVAMDQHNVFSFRHRRFPGGKLRTKVLPPIETEGKTEDDIPELMETCRAKMLEALEEISPERVDYGSKSKKE